MEVCGGVSGEPSPAVVYVNLLPVVEACVVVAVPGRVGEVRVAADEPEAVDLDPGVLARRLDAPKKFAFNRVSRVFAVFETHLRPNLDPRRTHRP